MASCELKVKDYLLSGLKVVDCATVIAAPAAAMMLADFGADVVKIEQPGEGDMLRMLAGISGFETDSNWFWDCLLYTSPSPRDQRGSRMPSSA